MKCSMTVNGKKINEDVSPSLLLVNFLRDNLKLTGTHVGCDTSQCGCCVVHIDGCAAKSCTQFAWQLDGCEIVTIEGIGTEENLHPMQEAFRKNHALQCGYCTPGMIMSSVDIVNRLGADLDSQTIRDQLNGNICRCTGYHNIVLAVQEGALSMCKKNGVSTINEAHK